MRISYNWLKELLPKLTLSPEEVADKLTMHSFETEVVGEMKMPEKTIVAKIVKLEKHPNADRLQLATIDLGKSLTVICGAPNIYEGAVVPYSPPGTILKDENGDEFELKVAKIRGVESPGMLNSPRELGLGQVHESICILPEDTPLGSKLGDHLPADVILEADITPNRADDCMSHLGIARELAALLNLEVKEAKLFDLARSKTLESFEINIENPNDTLRYQGVLLDDIKIKPSPFDIQVKLWAAGGKPINNVVDATNLVLFELGQPTHAFDTSSLESTKLGVRRAQDGEKVEALDEIEYELTGDDLVVTDDDKPVAIAGVMGGLGSGIKEGTSQVFLEAANFRSFAIQETSRRLKLISESSKRFSKGISPVLVDKAAARVVQLLIDHAGARVAGFKDNYPNPVDGWGIKFRPERVRQLSGSDISDEQSKNVLVSLGCKIAPLDSSVDGGEGEDVWWSVTPPPERLDLQGEHDLVEEVVRVIGLESIEPSNLKPEDTKSLPNFVQTREVIRDLLISQGFTETMSYSFGEGGELEVQNPISPEQSTMRLDILTQLLTQLLSNRSELKAPTNRESAMFEIGIVFGSGVDGKVEGIVEKEHLAVVVVGQDAAARVAGLKTEISQTLGIEGNLDIQQNDLTEKVSSKLGVPVEVFEVCLSELIDRAELKPAWQPKLSDTGKAQQFVELPKYPAVYRDLSILIAPDVTVEQVQEIIERVGGDLVVDVDLFDEYTPQASDETSLAFHITYQSQEKTLSDQEVAKMHNKIVMALYEEINAKLRE